MFNNSENNERDKVFSELCYKALLRHFLRHKDTLYTRYKELKLSFTELVIKSSLTFRNIDISSGSLIEEVYKIVFL